MLPDRPVLQLPLRKTDKALEAIALALLLLLWVSTILIFRSAPEVIPVHFNLHGQPDGYGNRGFLFMEAGIATLVYGLLTVLNRYPHRMNYIVTITADNAAFQYRRMTRLLRWIKLIMLAFMTTILLQTSLGNTHRASSSWVILAFSILMVVVMPLLTVLYTTAAEKKKDKA